MDLIEKQISEYGEIFVPRRLSQFLAVREWAPRPSGPHMQTWLHDAGEGSRLHAVHLPMDPSLADYEKRLNEAVFDMAAAYHWSVSELAEQVASIQADLYFVRIKNPSADGTIPLHLAGDVLASVEKLVKAAANRTNNPHASGKGRSSERVKEFLEEDLRMGHTKRGSFIITVAARLQEDHIEESVNRDELVDETSAATKTENDPGTDGDTGTAPTESRLDFSRRVMTTLSKALNVTQRHLAEGDDFLGFDEAVADGMLAPIVEAVEELATVTMGGGIDMTFQWAAALPQETEVPDSVTFSSEALERAPKTLRRFRQQEEPSDSTTLSGFVVALEREEGDDVDSGEIVLQTDLDGSSRKVRVDLAGVDYEWAVVAHRKHLPFTVSGQLGKRKNRWALVADIEADTSFLQIWQKRRIEAMGGDAPETVAPPEV